MKLLDLALREIGKKEAHKTKAGKKGKEVVFPDNAFQVRRAKPTSNEIKTNSINLLNSRI